MLRNIFGVSALEVGKRRGGGGVVEFLCKWGHICVVSLVLMYANFPKTKGNLSCLNACQFFKVIYRLLDLLRNFGLSPTAMEFILVDKHLCGEHSLSAYQYIREFF